jgi:hypothetical protein
VNGDAAGFDLVSEGLRALTGWERDGETLGVSDATRGTVDLIEQSVAALLFAIDGPSRYKKCLF